MADKDMVRIVGAGDAADVDVDLRPAYPMTYGDMKAVQKLTGGDLDEIAKDPDKADGALLYVINKAQRAAGKPEVTPDELQRLRWEDVSKVFNTLGAGSPSPDPTS